MARPAVVLPSLRLQSSLSGVCASVSVEPGGVELRLLLDAGVQLEHLSDGHGGIGGGRQGELHAQSPVLPL